MATTPPSAAPDLTTTPLSPGAAGGGFEFPREYHFPPFFTRQANLTTYHSQRDKWSSLILAYCRHHRLFRLSLTSPATEELFFNRKLDRRLSLADARDVLDYMRKEGRAEPVPGGGSGSGGIGAGLLGGEAADKDGGDVYWVYWRTPEEWAGMIEAWVDETGQKGTVLTLYELTDGEGTRGTEFHGLDPDLLPKALQVLVKRGKAQIFGQEDSQGVKFF